MIVFNSLGRYGRFANQVAQICGTIGIATKNAQPFSFPRWINHDHREPNDDIEVWKHLVNPLPLVNDNASFIERGYSFGYHDISLPKGNWDIKGHFQSERYFSHCIDLVRYYLTFKQEPKDQPYTALHFRGGDYSGNNASYHPRQTMDYYEKAMALIPGPYLVFSDEPETAKTMFGHRNDVYYVEGNDYLTDFALMKRCKHFICGNSSFSLMAAILANQEGKRVAAPSNWFGPAFGSGYKEMSKDIYSNGWHVI